MYSYMLLIFFILGIYSHFVPLEITQDSEHKLVSNYRIREMLCILNKSTFNDTGKSFVTPSCVTDLECAPKTIETIIQELSKTTPCLQIVKSSLTVLKEDCPRLRIGTGKASCTNAETDFNFFKNQCITFLKFIQTYTLCHKTQDYKGNGFLADFCHCGAQEILKNYGSARKESHLQLGNWSEKGEGRKIPKPFSRLLDCSEC